MSRFRACNPIYFDYARNMESDYRTAVSPAAPDAVAAAFSALGSPARLAVLRLLVRAGEGGLPVGALQARLEVAASTLSHHLRALVQAGLVVQERDGQRLICRADYGRVQALAEFLLSECCADAPEGVR